MFSGKIRLQLPLCCRRKIKLFHLGPTAGRTRTDEEASGRRGTIVSSQEWSKWSSRNLMPSPSPIWMDLWEPHKAYSTTLWCLLSWNCFFCLFVHWMKNNPFAWYLRSSLTDTRSSQAYLPLAQTPSSGVHRSPTLFQPGPVCCCLWASAHSTFMLYSPSSSTSFTCCSPQLLYDPTIRRTCSSSN